MTPKNISKLTDLQAPQRQSQGLQNVAKGKNAVPAIENYVMRALVIKTYFTKEIGLAPLDIW